jgi:hypothetical protein
MCCRCNQEEFYSSSSSRVQCQAQYIMNPNNMYTILQNVELRKSSSYREAVQVRDTRQFLHYIHGMEYMMSHVEDLR